MTLKEAHILTLRVLKQVMEEKLDQHNVQLAQVRILSPHDLLENENLIAPLFFFLFQVTPGSGFEILDEARLKAIIEEM
jgi:20S proteasome subunit alpha 5